MEIREDMIWRVECYGSGTHIVTTRRAGEPWLYVYGPYIETSIDKIRFRMCEEIADFMNDSSKRPAWLDDMRRISETRLEGVDGSTVFATGPMYDKDPPKCYWTVCEDQESKDKRARLMDRLCLGSKT